MRDVPYLLGDSLFESWILICYLGIERANLTLSALDLLIEGLEICSKTGSKFI